MKEPADVVVVVERSEKILRFVFVQSERGERHRFAGLMCQKIVAVNKFAKGQHGTRGTTPALMIPPAAV